MYKFFIKILPLAIVCLLSLFALKPIFSSGFFPIHDDVQVARIFTMGQSLRDGMFPVRWVTDLGYGYGYPIFNYYAPLAYYLGGFLVFLGADALLATKITIILGMFLSSVFMYFLAKEFFGKIGGIISALFYQYAIYHAVDLYVRGDVAELWAYGFIPLVFLGFYKIFISIRDKKTNFKIWIPVSSIGYSFIIISHNLTAMMITPFLIVFIALLLFISEKKLLFLSFSFYAFFLGITLSAFYWLPAILEIKYSNVLSQIGDGANFRDHFVCPAQFWYSTWGYGGSVKGCNDGISFMIGKLYIILTLFLFIFSLFNLKIKKNLSLIIIFSFICFIFSIFLQTQYSQFIWEFLPVMAFFQYPWRFLIMVSFFSSLIIGSSIYFFKKYFKNKNLNYFFVAAIILSLLYFQVKFFNPQEIIPVSSNYYTNIDILHFKESKISDEYMPVFFDKPKNIADSNFSLFSVLPKNVKSFLVLNKTQEKVIKVSSSSIFYLRFNVAYFPSWEIFVDGKKQNYIFDKKGMGLFIEKGDHLISLKFQQTSIQKIADIVSVIGAVVIIAGIII